jgi:hypothetical protein
LDGELRAGGLRLHGEPAVLFCFIFLFLWGNGAGPYSLDEMIRAGRAPAA